MRKCIIKNNPENIYSFHGFHIDSVEYSDYAVHYTVAILEDTEGNIITSHATDIKFLDTQTN